MGSAARDIARYGGARVHSLAPPNAKHKTTTQVDPCGMRRNRRDDLCRITQCPCCRLDNNAAQRRPRQRHRSQQRSWGSVRETRVNACEAILGNHCEPRPCDAGGCSCRQMVTMACRGPACSPNDWGRPRRRLAEMAPRPQAGRPQRGRSAREPACESSAIDAFGSGNFRQRTISGCTKFSRCIARR